MQMAKCNPGVLFVCFNSESSAQLKPVCMNERQKWWKVKIE